MDDTQIRALYEQSQAIQNQLVAALRSRGPEPIADATLTRPDGRPVQLSELFGDHDEMLLVHNMGKGCSYCTLWADGFNGIADHLANRAAFVLVSPDAPADLGSFAAGRSWRFDCASAHGTSFVQDLGYEPKPGVYMPGLSSLLKTADGSIERVVHTPMGPGDMYCNLWHMLDLLPRGVNGWEPKYEYA